MESNVKPARRAWLARSRAWISILLLTPFAVAAAASWPSLRSDSPWHFLLETTGWVCFLVGVGIRWWATLYIGGRKRASVISQGPYSICRNPLYLGTFLIALSIAFYLSSLSFAVGLGIAGVFYWGVTVSHEEQRLAEMFGDEYTRYCQEVPRFLPRICRPQTAPVIEVVVEGMQAELIRAARYAWVPLIAQTVAHLRLEAWWPHFWKLP